jgi:hypothetical protein
MNTLRAAFRLRLRLRCMTTPTAIPTITATPAAMAMMTIGCVVSHDDHPAPPSLLSAAGCC